MLAVVVLHNAKERKGKHGKTSVVKMCTNILKNINTIQHFNLNNSSTKMFLMS